MPRKRLDATGRKIIEAVVALLADQGYAATTIGAVSVQLKISKGVVHYHFPSKEILLQETVAYIYQQARDYMQRQVWRTDDAWRRIETFIVLSCHYYAEHGQLIRALQEIRANFRPMHARSLVLTFLEKELTDLQGVVMTGQANDMFYSFDPHIGALTLRMALNGAAGKIIEADNPQAESIRYATELSEMFRRAWCK